MKLYDTLGIALHSGQPVEVDRIAREIREWLNERAERGYTFVGALSLCTAYAAVVIVEQKRDPLEHGD